MILTILIQLVFFAVFGLLARLWPDRPGQSLLREGLLEDVAYFLLGVLVYSQIFAWLGAHAAHLGWAGAAMEHARQGLQDAARRQPFALQFAEFMLGYDLMQYWLHRWLHGDRLWRIHAVHHSATEIDVLTSFRWHPANLLLYVGVPTFVMTAVGFSIPVYVAAGMVNLLVSALSHANLDWTWGPLRYVVVSPMFHRWHHARLASGGSCNYSPNFPFYDLMFGTFHMPVGERPEAYGFDGAPQGLTKHFAYPFVGEGSALQPRDQGGGGGVVAQQRAAL